MKNYSATTIEEAIKAAEKDLGQSRDEMKIKVVQQPRHGFLGIGRRSAKIEVRVKSQKVVKTTTQQKPPRHRQKSHTKPQKKTHHDKKQKRAADSNKKNKQVITKKKTQRSNTKKRSNQSNEISQEEMEHRHQANLAKTKSVAMKMADYLHEILDAMGVENKVELTTIKSHEVTVDIKADKSGRVIGHHGRRINALEELASAFMDYHGADHVMVTVDTANYRQRRRETLKRVAENAVVDVISTGQAVFLDPMPARERKQLHRELEHNKHVITYSNGKEPHRSVVIAPKN